MANISIIGTGYVGLSTAVGFALKNHQVICVDIDREKVEAVNKGKPNIYEEGLEEALKKVVGKGLKAATDLENAIANTEVSFICVGTPDKNGKQDLGYLKKASKDMGKAIKNKKKYHLIAVKSTVLPKTTEDIILAQIEKSSGKKAGKDFGLCVNPEFLREGKALEDFLNPDRIVIGEYDKKSGDILGNLYSGFNAHILRTDMKTAEMIKYASNAFLATKISFINEMGNICKRLGIDVYKVADGLGHDKRIGRLFLDAGCGFGGSCFKKDIVALISKSEELGYRPRIMKSVIEVNENQPLHMHRILKKRLIKLKGKKIAVLGLAFKPGTDDIREASSIKIIKKLLEEKAIVHAYDPKAIKNMRKMFPNITYFDNHLDALRNADACLILTEWPEFNKFSDKDFTQMRQKIIIEGRRIIDKDKTSNFEGVCW